MLGVAVVGIGVSLWWQQSGGPDLKSPYLNSGDDNVVKGPWPGSTTDPDSDTTISDILDDLLGPLDPPKENDNPDICPEDPDLKDRCIEMCLPYLDIGDGGWEYHKCVNDCMKGS